MMDPPWKLASSTPARGVTIKYDPLNDTAIMNLPIEALQSSGFLFIWVINSKYEIGMSMMRRWGYEFCDEISWIKLTSNNHLAKGNGYYLQHAKEICLVGVKGDPWNRANTGIVPDCILSKRRGQSQKPDEIYDIIERMVPNGYYIEIFGRRNNLRNGWITIGNEL